MELLQTKWCGHQILPSAVMKGPLRQRDSVGSGSTAPRLAPLYPAPFTSCAPLQHSFWLVNFTYLVISELHRMQTGYSSLSRASRITVNIKQRGSRAVKAEHTCRHSRYTLIKPLVAQETTGKLLSRQSAADLWVFKHSKLAAASDIRGKKDKRKYSKTPHSGTTNRQRLERSGSEEEE